MGLNNDGKDDGGQAFPRAGSTGMTARLGMSLRDWFAGQALMGMGWLPIHTRICRHPTLELKLPRSAMK